MFAIHFPFVDLSLRYFDLSWVIVVVVVAVVVVVVVVVAVVVGLDGLLYPHLDSSIHCW